MHEMSYTWQLLARYKTQFMGVVFLALLSAIINTSFGAILKLLTDGLQKKDTGTIIIFIALFSAQRLLLPIISGGGTLISNRLANRIESDIREKWYGYVTKLDYYSAGLKNSGEFQKKIQEAVYSVRSLLNNTFRSLLSILLELIIISFLSALFIAWEAGLTLLIFAALYSIFVIWITKKRVTLIREIAHSDTDCTAFMHDSFINTSGVSPRIRANRSRQHEILLADLENKKNHNSWKLFIDSVASSVICLSACLLILLSSYEQRPDSAGAIVMLATGLAQLIIQINTLGFNYRNILSAKVDLKRISESLAIPSKITTSLITPHFSTKHHQFSFSDFRPKSSTTDIKPSIHGSITIHCGTISTLQGPSGIGKSTVARAMRGEVRAQDKKLIINGKDANEIDRDLLLEKINHISQDNLIFNESIERNLQYGKPDASNQEIVDCLLKAGLHKFLNNLEYIAGEKGCRLSAGERQRLVIARGLLQDCEILILDEPFSGLDEKHAAELARTIISLALDTCIFVIMHQSPEKVFGQSHLINQHIMDESRGEIHIANRSQYDR